LDAIQNKTLDESILNERAEKMLELSAKSIPTLKQDSKYHKEKHHEPVLNIENILLLKASQIIAVIGEMIVSPRY
jgi:hypothetical protein